MMETLIKKCFLNLIRRTDHCVAVATATNDVLNSYFMIDNFKVLCSLDIIIGDTQLALTNSNYSSMYTYYRFVIIKVTFS